MKFQLDFYTTEGKGFTEIVALHSIPHIGESIYWDGSTYEIMSIAWTPQNEEIIAILLLDQGGN